MTCSLPMTANIRIEASCRFRLTPNSGILPRLTILLVAAMVAALPRIGRAQQNSTAKLRVQPSPVAQRIGTAISWESDVDQAFAKARQADKPVFWYVPTVPGSFMDRKTEIDRYMKAGPFSWPAIVARINQHFVPLQAVPTGEQAQRWNLVPYRFVEPGFLVLNPQGDVLQRCDQLTTLHPTWLLRLIGNNVEGVPPIHQNFISTAAPDSALRKAWIQFQTDPATPLKIDLEPDASPEEKLEAQLLIGMHQYYSGQHQTANQTWRAAIFLAPDHPLAWKCAAEREGFGPFVRGFETHDTLPEKAFLAGIDSRGSAAPPDTFRREQLWRRSVEFLLRLQRQDGAIIDSDYDFGGTDSLPNVYVAVTSLAGCALLSALDEPSLADQQERIRDALLRIQKFVLNDEAINRADRDEILWAYAYRLKFLCQMKAAGMSVEPKDLQRCADALESVQSRRGAWYHEYANSFVTATALLSLKQAEEVGVTVDPQIIQLGITSLKRDRFENGAYPYSSVREEHAAGEEGSIAASAGRMPVCEMALYRWNASDAKRLGFAITQSFQHYDKLRIAYKYDNHTSTLAYGGFFFWYDLQNRAEAIASLPDPEIRNSFADSLTELVMGLPEIDGRFVDSHELGRAYGTSMALICLGASSPGKDRPKPETAQ